MKKLLTFLVLLSFLILPVSAMEYTAPPVPESAEPYMPPEQENLAQGVWYIIKTALAEINPELASAAKICLSVILTILLVAVLQSLTDFSVRTVQLTGAVVIGILLLAPANTLIQLGIDTVTELSDYGKLLLPVMSAAMAAQGGVATSAALYAGTVFFLVLLSKIIVKVIIIAIHATIITG